MGEGIKYCRRCGKQLNIDAKFCRYCGYQFEAVQKVKAVINPCPQCGKDNARGAKFCRFCGAGLAGAEAGAAAIHAKSYATRQETIPQMPELRMSAASVPGEFDYGGIDLESIAEGAVGKAASAAMAKAPGIELLSPAKVLGNSIIGFLKGIVSLFRDPKSAIVPIVFAVLWIVLAFLRDSDLLPVRALSWLTFAEGGLDRSGIAGMIGGILGKGVVAAALGSLFTGGIPNFFKGIGSVFQGTGEKRSFVSLVTGAVLGAALYFAFTGPELASKATAMAGIAGAVLSLESISRKEGPLYSLAQSLTSKVQDGVRTAQSGKAQSLLSGLVLGFAIATALMAFAGR